MVKVKFENPTGNRFKVKFPGKRLEIPPHACGKNALVTDLPDLPVVGKWLDDLVARHRAIKVSPVDSEGEDTTQEDTETGEGNEVNGLELTFNLFKGSIISVKEGGGGWWTIEAKDTDPIKVRSCKSEEEAILEAFNKYIEG